MVKFYWKYSKYRRQNYTICTAFYFLSFTCTTARHYDIPLILLNNTIT